MASKQTFDRRVILFYVNQADRRSLSLALEGIANKLSLDTNGQSNEKFNEDCCSI